MNSPLVRRTFAKAEDGQIFLYEGCAGCNKQPLDHHPIKIPRVEWEWIDEEGIPVFTRWYDLYCFTCAVAVLAPEDDERSAKYREAHGLTRITFKELQCPKATKEEIEKKMK